MNTPRLSMLATVSDQVVGDAKNWTWVLERRCDDCGFDATSFDVSHAGAAIRDLGSRWYDVLRRSGVSARPRPDKWSPLEYGCHVRDVFRITDERLALMLSAVDPPFANWDQDATAIADDYASQDAQVVATQLTEAAGALADRFDAVVADQWGRRGFRSDGSAFTVESLGRYLLHDPVHHLWDVNAEVPSYT